MRKPLTQAELNAMPRITPTEAAEQVWQADRLKQHRPMPLGQAGIPIPAERSIYRATIDGPLLKRIIGAAYAAMCQRELPPSAHASAMLTLLEDLVRRYPAADMAVLSRYGLTEQVDRIMVEMLTRSGYDRPHWLTPAEPVTLPKNSFRFHVDLGGGNLPCSYPPVPQALEPYLRKVLETRRAKLAFDAILGWPSQFKVRNARWPRWVELEREFAGIGTWLAAQREALA